MYEANIRQLIDEKYPRISNLNSETQGLVIQQLWWVQQSNQFTPHADARYQADSQWKEHLHREIFRALSSIELLLLLRSVENENIDESHPAFILFTQSQRDDKLTPQSFNALVEQFKAMSEAEADAQIRARLIAAVTLSPEAKQLANTHCGENKYPYDSVQFSGHTVTHVGQMYPVFATTSPEVQAIIQDCYPDDVSHWRHALFLENSVCLQPWLNRISACQSETEKNAIKLKMQHWINYWVCNALGFNGHTGDLVGCDFVTESVFQRAKALETAILTLFDVPGNNPLQIYSQHCLATLGITEIEDDKAFFAARLLNMANLFSSAHTAQLLATLHQDERLQAILHQHQQTLGANFGITYAPGLLQNVVALSSQETLYTNLINAMYWLSQMTNAMPASFSGPLSLRLLDKNAVNALIQSDFQLPVIPHANGELSVLTEKPFVFLVSSLGDCDLAAATANKLATQGQTAIILPMTSAARRRLETKKLEKNVIHVSLAHFDINEKNKQLAATDIQSIAEKLISLNPHRLCVGVSSYVDEEKALQLAEELANRQVPLTIFNEHMFELDAAHKFHEYQGKLASNPNTRFAVPTPLATGILPPRETDVIGHLSLDPAASTVVSEKVFEKLNLEQNQSFAFISGTTQATEVDTEFLAILLEELRLLNNRSNPPLSMQIRFGIHPGVEEMGSYFDALLKVCERYPDLTAQFKIILNEDIKSKLQLSDESMLTRALNSEFVRDCDVTGPQAAAAATHIAQAVPGALTTQLAMAGKVVVTGKPAYLPDTWFATPGSFFTGKPGAAKQINEIGLSSEEDAAKRFSTVLRRGA